MENATTDLVTELTTQEKLVVNMICDITNTHYDGNLVSLVASSNPVINDLIPPGIQLEISTKVLVAISTLRGFLEGPLYEYFDKEIAAVSQDYNNFNKDEKSLFLSKILVLTKLKTDKDGIDKLVNSSQIKNLLNYLIHIKYIQMKPIGIIWNKAEVLSLGQSMPKGLSNALWCTQSNVQQNKCFSNQNLKDKNQIQRLKEKLKKKLEEKQSQSAIQSTEAQKGFSPKTPKKKKNRNRKGKKDGEKISKQQQLEQQNNTEKTFQQQLEQQQLEQQQLEQQQLKPQWKINVADIYLDNNPNIDMKQGQKIMQERWDAMQHCQIYKPEIIPQRIKTRFVDQQNEKQENNQSPEQDSPFI